MRLSVTGAAIASLLAISVAPNQDQAYSPMFRGNAAHTGVSTARMFAGQGGIHWRVRTGGPVRATPAVTFERVYVGSGDGFLYALDRRNGRVIWRTDAGSPVHGSPAVTQGRIIVTTLSGKTVAVDEASGKVRWTRQAGAPLPSNTASRARYDYEYFTSSPVVAGNLVIVGAWDGAIAALDLRTGRQQWHRQTNGRIVATPAIANSTVYAPSFDGKVYALDLRTGADRWIYRTVGDTIDLAKTGYDRRGIQGSPAVANGHVYVGSRDGGVYALDQRTGELRWRASHGGSWIVGSPAIDGDSRLYVGSSDARFIQALDASSGRELWRVRVAGNVQSSPLRVGDLLIVATYTNQPEDGPAELLALNAATGAQRWRLPLGAPTVSSVVAADDELYVGTDGGEILSIHETNAAPVRLAVFHDSMLTARSTLRGSRLILEYFRGAGYQQLGADSLQAFLTARLLDGAPSVVVFATDALPRQVAPTLQDTVLFRRYLDAGGKVVWLGIPAGVLVRDSLGARAAADVPGSERLLGVSYDSIMFDNLGTSPTALGRAWGVSESVAGDFAVRPDGIRPLGLNEFGAAPAWVRNYRSNRPWTGYVQLWGLGATAANLEMTRAAAEYGLLRRATSVHPSRR